MTPGPRLLLDENITPACEADNWELGIDSVTARSRGLLSASDSTVFAFAQTERRTIVTTNSKAYLRDAALKAAFHHGLIIIPPELRRVEQRAMVTRVCQWVLAEFATGRTMLGRIVEFNEDGEAVELEQNTKLASSE